MSDYTYAELKRDTMEALREGLKPTEDGPPAPAMIAQAVNFLKAFPDEEKTGAWDLSKSPTLNKYAGKMGHSALS